MLAYDERVQADQPAHGDLEARRVEDLRADVAVQATQLQLRAREHVGDNCRCDPVGQRETELLVLVRGGDELVRVRLDPDVDADEHGRPHAAGSGERGDPSGLLGGVHDDPPHPVLQGAVDLRVGLVVAVQRHPRRVEPGSQADRQLPTSAGVQPQPLLEDPAGHRDREERLARVVDIRAAAQVGEGRVEGRLVLPRTCPQVCLVQEVRRSAVLGSEVEHGDTAHP